jgi:hypothetical protein
MPFLVMLESAVASLHDCHVHGLRWHRDAYAFSLDLEYIAEWIRPAEGETSFRFRVAAATLTFESTSDVKVSFDWTRCAPDAVIDALDVHEAAPSPNGTPQRLYELNFHSPDAYITLVATRFTLTLHHEPVLCRSQTLDSRL